MRYVILLRGVNVGGNHRVPKADLETVLAQLGFYDITIYLNSGNAVATHDDTVDSKKVQTALEDYFDFGIPTLVLPGEKIKAITEAIPKAWTNDTPRPDKSGQKSDVLYLFDEINNPAILEGIGYNPDIETMLYVDGAVIANITRKNQLRGSLQKLVGGKIYQQVTIRNINTARKLAELI